MLLSNKLSKSLNLASIYKNTLRIMSSGSNIANSDTKVQNVTPNKGEKAAAIKPGSAGKRRNKNRNKKNDSGNTSASNTKSPHVPKLNNESNGMINKSSLRMYHSPKLPLYKIVEMATKHGQLAGFKSLKNGCSVRLFFETFKETENFYKYLKQTPPPGLTNVALDKYTAPSESINFQKNGSDFYQPYWSPIQIKNGLRDGKLLQGVLRAAPKSNNIAFVTPDNQKNDVMIYSVQNRNRALPGDKVALKLLPRDHWVVKPMDKDIVEEFTKLKITDQYTILRNFKTKMDVSDENLQKSGEVVGIIKEMCNRTTVGLLSTNWKYNQNTVVLNPIDQNMPLIFIPVNELPKEYSKRPDDFKNKLYLAKITSWETKFPDGQLLDGIGNVGEIEPETKRILTQCDVEDSEFPAYVEDSLPVGESWKVPDEEFAKRKDLRNECIFTIDPSTAKDLDDALHCKKIGEDLFEVGVHIADVSHFVTPKSPVDVIAARRCTSVYLVQRVIPMLPPVLCDELCSLHPGVDRLAYSVIWTMNSKGEIKSEWFGRSVIHSCIKMSYDHAQSFIDEIDSDNIEAFPDISGNWSLSDLKEKVQDLHVISQNLRNKRMDDGALRLDQVKLSYLLNAETGLPDACFKYEYKKSNELIEEFMLLANMAVAHKLKRSLPDHAFLRCHPEPKEAMLESMKEKCRSMGMQINTRDSASFAETLTQAAGNDELSEYRLLALQLLAVKPQQLALYFCAGCVEDEDDYRHYALNVPLYTHFTSPIRRYADLIVHRQLSIALGLDEKDMPKPEDLQTQATLCNMRKANSKRAQDLSIEFFFTVMLKELKKIEGKGIVCQVLDRSFDVLSIEYGLVKRVYCEDIPLVGFKLDSAEDNVKSLKLLWNNSDSDEYKVKKDGKTVIPVATNPVQQTIKLFSVVRLVLEHHQNEKKSHASIKAYIKRNPDVVE